MNKNVPAGWSLNPLNHYVKDFIVPMRDKPKVFAGNTPWCRIEDFEGKFLSESKTKQAVDELTIKEMNLKVMPIGTVLCSCSATLGITAIVNHPLVTNQTFIGLVCDNSKLFNEYLYYKLNFDKAKLQNESAGTTIAYLSREKFEDFEVLIPDTLKEQKKIAEILTSVDRVIELTSQEIDKLKDLKKGMMQELLTKGIGHTKFKDSSVGKIPESWEELELSFILNLVNGRGFKPQEWKTKGIPIIRIQNINGSNDFNYYDGEYDPKIEINKNDLLFAWSGSRGTSFGPAIWLKGKGLLNYHTWKVIPKLEKVSSSFLLHLLRHITSRIENDAHGGSGLVHMQKWAMEEYRIGLPGLIEQDKISTVLSFIDEQIQKTVKKCEKIKTLKKGLMNDLLTGKVRVK